MRIYGLDFTSAPRPGKPITCLASNLENGQLVVDGCVEFSGFELFENFLNTPGPWAAGMDLPFGQPRKLIDNLGWPETWSDYVAQISGMTSSDFEQCLKAYREPREVGDKHHLREADKRADAKSPMMLYGVPVGRMFFEGAPRLMASGVNLPACRPNDCNRVVLEAYPALVVRALVGRQPYKSDTASKQTAERAKVRADIIQALRGDKFESIYGINLLLPDAIAEELVYDATGDHLDALLCAIQAAWASRQADGCWGVPDDVDPSEGWIADPALL